MYRIMLVVKEGSNYSSTYRYLMIKDENGKKIPYEATTLEDLDKKVEEMLNGDYRKKDFIIVQEVTYGIFADIAENVEPEVPNEPEIPAEPDVPEVPTNPDVNDGTDEDETMGEVV